MDEPEERFRRPTTDRKRKGNLKTKRRRREDFHRRLEQEKSKTETKESQACQYSASF